MCVSLFVLVIINMIPIIIQIVKLVIFVLIGFLSFVIIYIQAIQNVLFSGARNNVMEETVLMTRVSVSTLHYSRWLSEQHRISDQLTLHARAPPRACLLVTTGTSGVKHNVTRTLVQLTTVTADFTIEFIKKIRTSQIITVIVFVQTWQAHHLVFTVQIFMFEMRL